nr:hypothetical protein [Chroococcidiopsis sp. TS-821]
MKQFSLPLPIYILGGAFLAIASNYDKLGGLRLLLHDRALINSASQPSIAQSTAQSLQSVSMTTASASQQMQPRAKEPR